ncbi:MAG TPA: hypothetical protein VF796_08740, partial [Humisphaera sp.]
RGIIPWAIVDTTATGSGTSFAVPGGTNGVSVLQSTEYNASNAFAQNNNLQLTSGTTTAAAISGTQAIIPNSLTLRDGTTAAIPAGFSLALQSGGVLATGTSSTINGSGFVSGTTTNNLLFHVAGAGNTLTVNAPVGYTPSAIPGSFIKSSEGTLVLASGGNFLNNVTRVNAGTLRLAGGLNTLYVPLQTPPAATSNGGGSSGNVLVVNAGGTLDLNGNSQVVAGVVGNGASTLPGSAGVVTNTSGTAATFRVGNLSQAQSFAGSMTGNLNFQRQGGFTYTLRAPNTYTGTTLLTGGPTVLTDLATFENTSSVTLRGGVLQWEDTGLAAVANRLPAAAPINFEGGSLQFTTFRAGTNTNLSLGDVNLNRGQNLLLLNLNGSGGSANVTFNSLASRSIGSTLTVNTGNLLLGDNPSVTFATAPTLTNGIVGGWAINAANANLSTGNTGDFLTYDPVGGLKPVYGTVSSVSQYLPGANARQSGSVTLLGSTTVNSLSIATASTITYAATNDLLNIESGGLLTSNEATAKVIGASAGQGRLTAGGTASSGTRELFVHNLNNTLTINSRIVDNPNGAAVSPVFSNGNLNNGAVTILQGINTYTGTTYVSGQILRLNTTGGTAIPGNVIVNGTTISGGTYVATNNGVQLSQPNQIAPAATFTINGAGVLDLNSNAQSLATINLNNDSGENSYVGPAVTTGAAALTLTGQLNVTTSNSGATAVVSGAVDFNGGSRDVNVGVDPLSPNQIGLAFNAAARNGTLNKAGAGIMFVGGFSPATSSLTVSSGQVVPGNSGVFSGAVSLAAGTTMDMRGGTYTIGSLTGTGTVTNSQYTGGNTAGTLIVGSANTSTTFDGSFTNFQNAAADVLSGMPLNVQKVGTGTLTLTA